MTGLRRTTAFCLISGLISGLLVGIVFLSSSESAFAALQDPPASAAAWLGWVNWTPGIAFGLLFSASMRAPKHKMVLWMLASAACYVLAQFALHLVLAPTWGCSRAGLWACFDAVFYVPPGVVCAGLVGGATLAVTSLVLAKQPLTFGSLVAISLMGVVLAIVFMLVLLGGLEVGNNASGALGKALKILTFAAAFAIWQGGVGRSLAAGRMHVNGT